MPIIVFVNKDNAIRQHVIAALFVRVLAHLPYYTAS